MTFSSRLIACFVAALTVTPSFAQESRFCIGGNLDHLSKSELQACQSTLNEVRSASINLHGPAQWHYVVVCDEASWTDLAALSKRDVAELARVSVDSDLDMHLTFLRGAQLSGTDTVQRVVADEIASIQLETANRNAVQKQAALQLPKRNKQAAEMQSSLRVVSKAS